MNRPERQVDEENAIPVGGNQSPKPPSIGHPSSLKLFFVTFCAVVGSEAVIDFAVGRFQSSVGISMAIADSAISAFFVFILLYFIVFRNLRHYVTLLEQKEISLKQSEADYRTLLQELQDSHADLEQKVQQRTQEMAKVNRELRTEIATRRAAEAALQASESHLKQVIDQLPAVLWTVDRSLTMTSLLGSHTSEFQLQMEKLLQSAQQGANQPDEQYGIVSAAHAKALQGASTDFELRLEDCDFHCTVEPFHNTDGEIIGCLGIAVDITARKQAEGIIRRQHTALEAAADGIIITDEKGIIQWVNPAMTAITGYTLDEMIGSTPAIFKSNLHSNEFFVGLWKTILSGQIWRGETYNRRKDGSIYVEDQTITPVLEASGRIQNFIAIKHDITDRKKAEEEITRRNQELQALGEASIVLTRSLEPEVVIQAFLDLLEKLILKFDRFAVLTVEEDCLHLAGVRYKNPDYHVDQPALLEVSHYPLLQAVLKTRKSLLVEDIRTNPLWKPFLNGMDTRCWLGVPMQTGERMIGVCCLESRAPSSFNEQQTSLVEALVGHAAVAIQNARLYHEVHESRERLQSMSRRLVDVQESERRYIARELHDDTSQALVGLVFALEVLKRDAGDPQAVAASVAELDRLIGDILNNLHRLAVNLRPAALDHLGLIPAIRQYVDGLQDKYNIKINLTLPQLSERLSIDTETMLYRIIQEALANVVLHAYASNAELRMELLPGKLRALITDDGVGFNLDAALAQERLGLFGMRERAEMLGGTLAIDSAPGAGTRITLEVPCAFSDPDRG